MALREGSIFNPLGRPVTSLACPWRVLVGKGFLALKLPHQSLLPSLFLHLGEQGGQLLAGVLVFRVFGQIGVFQGIFQVVV